MKIPIKTPAEIEKMRASCRATAEVLDAVGSIVRPGVSTEEIDWLVFDEIKKRGGTPSTLNYKGYPKSCCVSPNDVICHGIPSPFVVLQQGDIVNVDVSVYLNGFHGDSSRMFLVGGEGAVRPEGVELVSWTRKAMWAGIKAVRPGGHIGDIGAAIQECLRGAPKKYGIVREYTGHGLGREFHEPPQVVHIGHKGMGDLIKPGMTFTVEPMVNEGSAETELSRVDGWTVRTADGGLSAQWEHTVLVTERGAEVLTLGAGEKFGE